MSDKRKKEEGGMEDKVGGREGEGRKEEVCVCILRCTSWANVHAPVVMTLADCSCSSGNDSAAISSCER